MVLIKTLRAIINVREFVAKVTDFICHALTLYQVRGIIGYCQTAVKMANGIIYQVPNLIFL